MVRRPMLRRAAKAKLPLDPVVKYRVYAVGRMNSDTLSSGKLAKAAGVNLETIRFHEREKLLPKPPRTASGYRLFPGETCSPPTPFF